MRKIGSSTRFRRFSRYKRFRPRIRALHWAIIQRNIYSKLLVYSVITFLATFMLLGTGCNKLVKIQEEKPVNKAVVNQPIKSVQSMEEMIVPKTFNWNTAQRIQMGVNIIADSGISASGVHIRVYYKDNSRGLLHEMVSGISNSEGKVDTTFNLPTYVRTVFIKTNETGERLFEVPVNSYMFDYTLRL